MSSHDQQILERLDEVMGKLQDMEQEFTLQMGKYETIGDLENKVDELEKRIETLEGGKS